MKLKRRPPLNLTAAEAPMAEPDNDLDMPGVAPERISGALAPAAQESQRVARHEGGDHPPAAYSGATAHARPVPVGDPARFIYLVAALASVLWAGLAVFALTMPAQAGLAGQVADKTVFVILTVAPVGFIWLLAYALRQGAALAAEIRRARAATEALVGPAAQAAMEAGSVVESVRHEIDAAALAAAGARSELSALREILAEESGRLMSAAAEAGRTAAALGQSLGREREQMGAVSAKLDGQALAVSDAVTRQARMVTEASDLAQAQITESEAALAARAADLAAAAGEASDAARIASEDLARQALRLETATVGVGDQTRFLETTLTDQRAALVALAHDLRGDNEDFAIRLETQRAQVAEMLTKARASVGEINEAATSGAGALRELAELAATHARDVHDKTAERIREIAETSAARAQELAQTAQAERDMLSAGALQSVGAVTEAARFEREALETDVRRSLEQLEADTRRALDAMAQAAADAHRSAGEHAEAARVNVMGLSEAAFAAGQKSEAAYEARMKEAQGLISRSAELVDQAAGQSAERLERAADNARTILDALESAVTEVEARVARLPAEATAQAEAMKVQLAHSFDDLLTSARTAAEETQAIDLAFQERVKRNYEMLSEAVRLMGVMSNPTARPMSRPNPTFTGSPPPAPAPEAKASDAAVEAPDAGSAEREPAKPHRRGFFERARSQPAAHERPSGAAPASQSGSDEPSHGLRPRLKLAPTQADESVSQMFEGGQAKPAAEEPEGGWTWQELLTSMDDVPVDEAQLADRLIGEIETLGVDLAAILPEARVHEIATVLETGDREGARLVVRHLAPAAVSRLSRRALTEPALRAHAERFVRRNGEAVDAAAGRDASGEAIARLLASESGRAFLLFDAVVGDLP
jgi:hypothetical protein